MNKLEKYAKIRREIEGETWTKKIAKGILITMGTLMVLFWALCVCFSLFISVSSFMHPDSTPSMQTLFFFMSVGYFSLILFLGYVYYKHFEVK